MTRWLLVMALTGCTQGEAWNMCAASGYPELKYSFDSKLHKTRYFCVRRVDGSDEMIEVHP